MAEPYALSSERALEEAKQKNMVVVFPAPDQLQIDIDSKEGYAIFKDNVNILSARIGVKSVEEHISKSGRDRKHVTVTLAQPLYSEVERILLQACLGSDRELLSYFQALARDPHPVLFLELPAQVAMGAVMMPVPIERQLATTVRKELA